MVFHSWSERKRTKEISLKNLSKIIRTLALLKSWSKFTEIKAYGHEDRKKINAELYLQVEVQLKHIKQLVEYITVDTRIVIQMSIAGIRRRVSSPLYATAVS
jgi:hypothetical protein